MIAFTTGWLRAAPDGPDGRNVHVRTGNAITSSGGASPGNFSLKGIDKIEVKIKRSTVGNRIFTRLKVTVTP